MKTSFNNILGLVLFSAFLVSCSPKDLQNTNKTETVITFEAKAGQMTPATADFGDVEFNQSKIITLRIKNTGTEIIPGPASLQASDFSLIYQSGCTNIPINNTCTIKIGLDARGKSPGPRSAEVELDPEVKFTVTGNILPDPAIGQEESNLVQMPETVDFGSLTQQSNVLKTIAIKNLSTGSLNKVVSVAAPYELVYDSCSNRNLASGSSCTIKVRLTGSSSPAGGQVTGTAIYGTAEIGSTNLTATVTPAPENAPVELANIIALYSVQDISQVPAQLGSLEQGRNYIHTFILKNHLKMLL